MFLYFFDQDFRKRPSLPGVVDAHECDAPFRRQASLRRAVKLKLKNNGLFFDFLDRGVHLKQITIKGREKKTAICSYFGHPELFFLVTKKCFR